MYSKQEPKSIQTMFNAIAPSYDLANKVLSLGLHDKWNQKLVDSVGSGTVLLDLCAGTGEIAFAYLKKYPVKAHLLDFSQAMLDVAEIKAEDLGFTGLDFIQGDAQAIPLENDSVDRVTIAYGIRNVQNTKKCLQEVYRVLQKGGVFGLLELTRPNNRFLQMGHSVYLKGALPILGKMITKNKQAYQYLSSSIGSFISTDLLIKLLQEVGFDKVVATPLMGGIATIITCTK